MSNISIREYEVETPTNDYVELIPAGENQIGNKIIARNTLASDRIMVRLNEDDDDVFTVSPGEKMTIGGFASIIGKKVEIKIVTDIVESFKLNVLG